MPPIRFTCVETFPVAPAGIAQQILDLAQWSGFQGYGPIPGIRSAVFETQPLEIVGTRIRVTNRDGSTHVEEIVEWQPDRCVRLRMADFSPPLSRLATAFDETWEFEQRGDTTRVVRSFAIHARSVVAWPLLWVMSFFLKAAIARHLRQLK